MEKERVTTEALRGMKPGETQTFKLADAYAIESGKTLAYRMQHISGYRFTAVSNYDKKTLTLTKVPKP